MREQEKAIGAMTVTGLEAQAAPGGVRRPPAGVASDVEGRDHDIKAGIDMALKRAPTKRHPVARDQEASKNRSPTKESVAFVSKDERSASPHPASSLSSTFRCGFPIGWRCYGLRSATVGFGPI
jgi:hypothetical protein